MSEDEWRRFVMEGTRTGKLATVRSDGSPNVVPIWFVLDDDGAFVFNTGAESAKGKAMRRDPRVALLVEDEQPPYQFVLARGDDRTGRVRARRQAATWETIGPRSSGAATPSPGSFSSAWRL